MKEYFKSIIKWASTNSKTGEPYHNLIHCLQHDELIIYQLVTITTFITFFYFLSAYNSYKMISYVSSNLAKNILKCLATVHFLCGLSGHLFTALSVMYPIYKIRLIALYFLLLAQFSFTFLDWYYHALFKYFRTKEQQIQNNKAIIDFADKAKHK